jgi:hypothetical protein
MGKMGIQIPILRKIIGLGKSRDREINLRKIKIVAFLVKTGNALSGFWQKMGMDSCFFVCHKYLLLRSQTFIWTA